MSYFPMTPLATNMARGLIWTLLVCGTGVMAHYGDWGFALPSALFLLAAVILWVGNILADRIEDHDHRRR